MGRQARPRVYIHRSAHWYDLSMDAANEQALRSFADVVVERGPDERVPAAAVVSRLRDCSAVLSLTGHGADDITPAVLEAAGTVRVICIAHYWGQFAALPASLKVSVVEGSNAGTIAVVEWMVAAALMGIRQLHVFDRRLKGGSPWGEPRRGVGMLSGSRVGIVGLGRIGRHAARSFRTLGAHVVAYSDSCSRELAAELGVSLVPLDELLGSCDVVSLTHRATDATRGRLGTREFARLKADCVFINAARAGLYDEAALVAELKRGRFTAYLDVYATEPLPLDHPFRTMPNVVLTPHIAGNNGVMFARCAREAIQTLSDFFEGKPLQDSRYSDRA